MQRTNIGNNIRIIRQMKGMKQAVFADMMGITQQSVSKMEKKESLTEEQLENVAKVLGVTSDIIKKFDGQIVVNHNFLFNDVHNHPIKEVIEYFKEELLKEHTEKESLREEIAALKAELGTFRSGSSDSDEKVKNLDRKAK